MKNNYTILFIFFIFSLVMITDALSIGMNTEDMQVALVAFHESPTSSAVYKPEYSNEH